MNCADGEIGGRTEPFLTSHSTHENARQTQEQDLQGKKYPPDRVESKITTKAQRTDEKEGRKGKCRGPYRQVRGLMVIKQEVSTVHKCFEIKPDLRYWHPIPRTYNHNHPESGEDSSDCFMLEPEGTVNTGNGCHQDEGLGEVRPSVAASHGNASNTDGHQCCPARHRSQAELHTDPGAPSRCTRTAVHADPRAVTPPSPAATPPACAR